MVLLAMVTDKPPPFRDANELLRQELELKILERSGSCSSTEFCQRHSQNPEFSGTRVAVQFTQPHCPAAHHQEAGHHSRFLCTTPTSLKYYGIEESKMDPTNEDDSLSGKDTKQAQIICERDLETILRGSAPELAR